MSARLWVVLATLLLCAPLRAEFDYALQARQIAPGVHLVEGGTGHFSDVNGGNIVNSAFIVSQAGVLVIDTGPSRLYGEQLRALIARTTEQPVVRVLNSHHHPDHFFGNQAFADLPIGALADARAAMQAEAGGYADNLYRLVGPAMIGTDVVLPTMTLTPGELRLGERRITLFALAGHSAADLVLLDHDSGVLFAGDLVFSRRAPTTPHADLARWRAALGELAALDFKLLVPGHGPMIDAAAPVAATRDYLDWLGATLDAGLARGMDMAELMHQPLPPRFAALGAMPGEYMRSVAHLYPALEQAGLPAPAVARVQ